MSLTPVTMGGSGAKPSHIRRSILIGVSVVFGLPIAIYLLSQAWIGFNLNIFPQGPTVEINGELVNTACIFDRDCRSAYSSNDYTQCSEKSLCEGGDVAVNFRSFGQLAQSKNFVELDRDCQGGFSETWGAGTANERTMKFFGCSVGQYRGAIERCFFFRCGIDYIDE
jgi:hypothetical protein